MEEYLLQAREELKRLEHIIYVSLKYTRTVDVIINALNRLVSTYDFIVMAFLEKAIAMGKTEGIPKSPALRATRVAQCFAEDKKLQNYLAFYTFLKTILNSHYERREEYRRHVTHIVELEKATSEQNIDSLESCEAFLHDFYTYSWETLVGKPEEDDF